MRSLATYLAAFALTLAASTAFAQDVGQDEVTLKNGGSIRGTVISSEPGNSVKILELGAKEPRVLPWSQVSDVEKGKYAPKAAPQPGPAGPGYGGGPPVPPPPPVVPAPRAREGGVVKLHIDSPAPVNILQHEDTSVVSVGTQTVLFDRMRVICTSPCDQPIDGRGQTLKAAGAFPGTLEFNLDGRSGDMNLTVKPGSWGRRIGGISLIAGLGAPGVIGGVTILAIWTQSKTADLGTRNAGVGVLIGSGAVLAGGILLVAMSGSSYKLEGGGGPTLTAGVKARWWRGEF